MATPGLGVPGPILALLAAFWCCVAVVALLVAATVGRRRTARALPISAGVALAVTVGVAGVTHASQPDVLAPVPVALDCTPLASGSTVCVPAEYARSLQGLAAASADLERQLTPAIGSAPRRMVGFVVATISPGDVILQSTAAEPYLDPSQAARTLVLTAAGCAPDDYTHSQDAQRVVIGAAPRLVPPMSVQMWPTTPDEAHRIYAQLKAACR